MPPHIDKVIVSSDAALTKKYLAAGKAVIDAAVARLIAADAARGLNTQYFSINGAAPRDFKDAFGRLGESFVAKVS